ncbi:rCG45355 [Rattus norvegicus]|uniref:RCG45355 n=1 Tax=Rattus norvegicus TaxID=10116 RepID=A6K9B7_RAT|nr:rCG45355 [Rattus norvegicus]
MVLLKVEDFPPRRLQLLLESLITQPAVPMGHFAKGTKTGAESPDLNGILTPPCHLKGRISRGRKKEETPRNIPDSRVSCRPTYPVEVP